MGIMLGSDENNSIGVAPEAKWIATRNMDRGWGTLYTYLESFQWFLAPTDLNNQNPDPGKAPHIINNSWSCPEEEGCSPDLFPILEEAIENLISAGIVVVVAGGNSGRDGCHTVDAPSAIYEKSFTVGASTIDDEVAAYSSRGPVIVDNSYRTKPNVVAPGSSVRSASTGQGFLTGSGTSAASPHVAGTIALMISANPELEGKVNLIRKILIDTAVPLDDELTCGPLINNTIPNNTFGHGRINAYAAVQTAINLEAYLQNQQFSIYPNPFFENLNIDLPIDKKVDRILIWNAKGQMVQEIPLFFGIDQKKISIPTHQFHQGIYFYQIIGEDWKQSGKLIKL
jgi:subtilisin family serine protease